MGMMDVRQKAHVEDDTIKCCVHCNTTNTPLWRGGPAGPKSLCNACGIRFRKRRMSTNRGFDTPHHHNNNNRSTALAAVSATTSSTSRDGEEEDLGECSSLRMRLMMPFGEEVVLLQNLPSSVKKQRCQRRRKLGDEEEQAAVSLMVLSGGSVFA